MKGKSIPKRFWVKIILFSAHTLQGEECVGWRRAVGEECTSSRFLYQQHFPMFIPKFSCQGSHSKVFMTRFSNVHTKIFMTMFFKVHTKVFMPKVFVLMFLCHGFHTGVGGCWAYCLELGVPVVPKVDVFLEKVQTAFDSPPPSQFL